MLCGKVVLRLNAMNSRYSIRLLELFPLSCLKKFSGSSKVLWVLMYSISCGSKPKFRILPSADSSKSFTPNGSRWAFISARRFLKYINKDIYENIYSSGCYRNICLKKIHPQNLTVTGTIQVYGSKQFYTFYFNMKMK
jgi:hypothetical protein